MSLRGITNGDAVAISRKGNLVLIDTNFDLFFGVFAKIIAKKNKYYG